MRNLRYQCIWLSVMLLLIAVLISILPEYPPLQQAQKTPANNDVAANTVEPGNTTGHRN